MARDAQAATNQFGLCLSRHLMYAVMLQTVVPGTALVGITVTGMEQQRWHMLYDVRSELLMISVEGITPWKRSEQQTATGEVMSIIVALCRHDGFTRFQPRTCILGSFWHRSHTRSRSLVFRNFSTRCPNAFYPPRVVASI